MVACSEPGQNVRGTFAPAAESDESAGRPGSKRGRQGDGGGRDSPRRRRRLRRPRPAALFPPAITNTRVVMRDRPASLRELQVFLLEIARPAWRMIRHMPG